MRRREETSTSRLTQPRGARRLPPTLPRRDPAEVSAFIDGERANFAVELLCSTLEVSVSAYYARERADPSARAVEDARLLAVIREVHAKNYDAYGYRRTWKALLRAGEIAPRCQVQRLMRTDDP